jgi:hypothetical protein
MDRNGCCGQSVRVGIPISGKIKASCASQLFGVAAPPNKRFQPTRSLCEHVAEPGRYDAQKEIYEKSIFR